VLHGHVHRTILDASAPLRDAERKGDCQSSLGVIAQGLPPARGGPTVRQDELDMVRRPPYEGEGGRIAREANSRADLKEAAVGSFLRAATPHTARCRQIIHYEGRPTSGVYFVESGRIKCISSASDGRELLLTEFGAGEFFGVIEALSGTRAVATAVATETSMLRFVHNELFRKLLVEDSELALTLVQVLAQRLKSAYERHTDLAYETIDRRILRTLSSLACWCDGALVVKRALSINELASMVAASRTRVSIAVQDLIRRGRLSRIEGKFVISSEAQPA
jgi:CRP/FNR family transcriptional regulator, cyclic AMP receptor protein